MKIDSGCRAVAVTVTPFVRELKPDLEEIARQTEFICSSGVDAILPCASTGEAVKMDFEDRLAVLKVVRDVNRSRKKLIAGACETSAEGTERDIRAAASLGYDACLVCPPFYYGLSQKDVAAFYGRVCAFDSQMEIVAYHVPFFTTGIEIPTFTELLSIPNLVGLKDSSANLKRIAHLCSIVSEKRPEFGVYTGTDDILFPALCAGCRGSMTALAATLPDWVESVYRAFDERRMSDAIALQSRILPLIREADRLLFPAGYVLLAKARGMKLERALNEQEADVYAKILKKLEELA